MSERKAERMSLFSDRHGDSLLPHAQHRTSWHKTGKSVTEGQLWGRINCCHDHCYCHCCAFIR